MTPFRFPNNIPDIEELSKAWLPRVLCLVSFLMFLYLLLMCLTLSLLFRFPRLFIRMHRPGEAMYSTCLRSRQGNCRLVFISTCIAVRRQPLAFPLHLDLAPAADLFMVAGIV